MSATALCAVLAVALAAPELEVDTLTPPPLIKARPGKISLRPPADAPLERSRSELALEAEQRLQDWRGRLLDERRPGVGGPVVLASLSLAMLVTSGILLGTLQPFLSWKPFWHWAPPLAALALHFVFSAPASVLFGEKVRERVIYDSAPPPTVVDTALQRLSSESPETREKRDQLLEKREELLRELPGRGSENGRFAGGAVLALLSTADWVLLGVHAHRFFDNPRLTGMTTLGGVVIALGVTLALGSVVLFLSGRAAHLEADAETERVEAEIRDVERRILALDRER